MEVHVGQVFSTFTKLGGIYIKFLQALALSPSFMQGWATPAHYRVFEAVDYDELDIYQLLVEELGEEALGQFRTIGSRPIAAGSFGQVYKASFQDDRQVIIKVLRPSLAGNLRADIRLLRWTVRAVSCLQSTDLLDFRDAFDEFASTSMRETDYIHEAETASWFYNYFRSNPQVVIPATYRSLCSKRVICQDYIGGFSLAELLDIKKSGHDPAETVKQELGSDLWWQIELLGHELVRASLWSEFLFGDPHPGNIKLLAGNKIGLIDFGIAARAPTDKRTYLELLMSYKDLYDGEFHAGRFLLSALRFFDVDLAASIGMLDRHYALGRGSLLDKIGKSSDNAFHTHLNQGLNLELLQSTKIIPLFNKVVNSGNRYGLKLDVGMLALLRSGRTYVDLLRQFGGQEKERQMMQAVLGGEVAYAKEHLSLLPEEGNMPAVSYEHAIGVVNDWLCQVANADPMLYIQLIRKRKYA